MTSTTYRCKCSECGRGITVSIIFPGVPQVGKMLVVCDACVKGDPDFIKELGEMQKKHRGVWEALGKT